MENLFVLFAVSLRAKNVVKLHKTNVQHFLLPNANFLIKIFKQCEVGGKEKLFSLLKIP